MAALTKSLTPLCCFLLALLALSSLSTTHPVASKDGSLKPGSLTARSPRMIPDTKPKTDLLSGLFENLGLKELSQLNNLSYWKNKSEPQEDDNKSTNSDNSQPSADNGKPIDDSNSTTPTYTGKDNANTSDDKDTERKPVNDSKPANDSKPIDDSNSTAPTHSAMDNASTYDEDEDHKTETTNIPNPTEDPAGFLGSLFEIVNKKIKTAFDSADERTLH